MATLTITATDSTGKSGNYLINFAVSDAQIDTATTLFHYGTSDASTAISVDDNFMWVADDEDQTLRLYDRKQSGLPVKFINFNALLGIDGEVDIEGSFQDENTIYWMGSHTNAERSFIFSTSLTGSGATSDVGLTGFYAGLRSDLMTWDANNLHGLGADFLGFNSNLEIEGLAADPNNPNGALVAFRGTLIDNQTVIVPVSNFKSLPTTIPATGLAQFGDPIFLDLKGRTIRSIDCNDNGCLLIGGPFGQVNDFKLYTWSGNAADAAELRAADLSSQANLSSFEGIASLPVDAFLGTEGDMDTVQLIVDTGTFDYYNNGQEAKDLPNAAWKKFRTELVVLGEVTVPPVANSGDVVINEIMQNPNAVTDANGEWFELYNTTAATIDLNGWRLSDADGELHIIDNGGPLEIEAKGYLVFGINADTASNGGVVLDYAYSQFNLGNGVDEIILTAGDNTPIDSVGWDDGVSFPDPVGASMALLRTNADNTIGGNWCVASTSYGAGDFGTPGAANDCPLPTEANLQVTEIWAGQDGTDLTADWFEITNYGEVAWSQAENGTLFYDDDSQDAAVADAINGITDIQPGESAIVVIDGEAAVQVFKDVWGPDYNLTNVQVGWADGSGLSSGGDGVTLFLGGPTTESIVDFEAYPAQPSGVSYDVVLGAFSIQGAGRTDTLGTNVAVATAATAGGSGTEPAIGSPGNRGPISMPMAELVITEIFPGQAGDDLTEDWFEITNLGTAPWTAGVDSTLYYDDESAEPADADPIQGITAIAPGATAIVLITDNPAAVAEFTDVWSPVIDLAGVEIGTVDGAGLGGGGDAVTLWLGNPSATMPIDTAVYPDTDLFDGLSYDVELMAFSEVGNANGAVQTLALGGNEMNVPNIGSPGNGLAIAPFAGIEITEIFPGQAGDDLTADWFEIKNTGNTTWIAGVDPDLYYDDESASGADADIIEGLTMLAPGASAIVLISNDTLDITQFVDVWSSVIDLSGIEIGLTDGAGLGGGGDAVTLWLGDPMITAPIDTASYPDTELFDGQSYDVELIAFSTVGNANGAVQTNALGGAMNTPNIGSPGNGLAIPVATGIKITEIFPGQAGDDLTVDWFEIKNTGDSTWVAGVNGDLYYDDESADPVDAVMIQGLTDLEPGETAIVLVTDVLADIDTFIAVWSEVTVLDEIEIGTVDGSGLGSGGDAVTLWSGNPNQFLPIDTAAYPDTELFDGQSYDVELQEFSVDGNANGAVTTLRLGGDGLDVPNVASPANRGPISNTREPILSDGVEVFPNPTSGWLKITPKTVAQIEGIQVLDVSGRKVAEFATRSKESVEIDFSLLPNAIYFIRIQTYSGIVVEKVVKE